MTKKDKTKKISISTFDKIMRSTNTPVKTVEWNGIEITIRKTLPLKDMLAFVDSVYKACFSLDDNTYIPEIKTFAIKCCVLEMYANFTLPSNVEHKYNLIYNTDAFDIVVQHINIRQLNEIIDATNEKIEKATQANIESINKQMSDAYAALDELQNYMSAIFSGIGSEDVVNFMSAVTNGGLDEEKLVQAYMKRDELSNGE